MKNNFSLKPHIPQQHPLSLKGMKVYVSGSKLPRNPKDPDWIAGYIQFEGRLIPAVETALNFSDRFSSFKCRISGFRMNFTVTPGLYAVGSPKFDSDLFVTANYKLSFDKLRSALNGIDGWILVLDTGGINVWCAAGKGAFGTAELLRRMKTDGLNGSINRGRVILPQLGAPGINLPEARRQTGLRINWGPVRADDIQRYITNGYTADKEMRTVRFNFIDRLILTPMEIVPVTKKLFAAAIGIFLLAGFSRDGIIFSDALSGGGPYVALLAASSFAGGVLTPVLLPFIPFRSFALKGLAVGAATTSGLMLLPGFYDFHPLSVFAAMIFFPALSSYLALQFTGASTFTGITGVKMEIKIALPLYAAAAIASAVLTAVEKLLSRGLL